MNHDRRKIGGRIAEQWRKTLRSPVRLPLILFDICQAIIAEQWRKTLRAPARLLLILFDICRTFVNKTAIYKVLRWKVGDFLFHPRRGTVGKGAYSTSSSPNHPELISRIKAAYRLAIDDFRGSGNSYWAILTEQCRQIHETLLSASNEETAKILDQPFETALFRGYYSWGQDNDIDASSVAGRYFNQLLVKQISDLLVRLAEATGAIYLHNPEAEGELFHFPHRGYERAEALLAAIEAKIGVRIDFPNPFGGEFGLGTSRGIASVRGPHAIYQAWRIGNLLKTFGGDSVLELGAGMGRTAYYAGRFGIGDYTVVDLPLANVAQAIFLGRALGADKIWLPGDPEPLPQERRIRLVPPEWFLRSDRPFDLVLNADSLVEMDKAHALEYFSKIHERARMLVSINHETCGFKVRELPALCGLQPRSIRYPYWLRKGYVEEIYFFDPAAGSLQQ